jgi:hypothetical protein
MKKIRVSALSIGDYLAGYGDRFSYFAEKVITDAQIISFFKKLFPSASISGNRITLKGSLVDHQDGDKYFIRVKMGNSYNNSGDNEPRDVLSYTFVDSVPSYTQSTAPVLLDIGVEAFDSLDVVGRKLKFHIPDDGAAIRSWVEKENYTSGEIVYSDGHYYLCVSSGSAGNVQPIHTSGTRSDGKISWRYLHSGTGSATITSVKSPTELTAVADSYLPVTQWGKNSYIWDNFQWSMWGYKNQWPSQVFVYKSRLCYIFTAPGYGTYFSASKTDEYNDFGTDDFGEVLDTSGITTIISGHKENKINWNLPGNHLYIGSYAGEYSVVGDNSGAITPTSINILPITSIGGAKVAALKFEDLNLFVGASRTELYAVKYDNSRDDFSPTNVGFTNTQLLEDKISRLQALKNTDRNIYFTTDSKQLRILNNSREVQRLGFYRANLSGNVLDIASSSAGERSLMFVLVERNGVTTAEAVASGFPSYMLSSRLYDTRSAGSDEEKEYVAAELIESDFAGKEVYIKDWETEQFVKVSCSEDGRINNPFVTQLLEVGLPMACEVHCIPSYRDKLEGFQQKSVRFLVRLLESGAFSYGSSHDFTKWYDYNNWSTTEDQEWDSSHKLMTGDVQLPASFGYMQGQNTADGPYPNDTGVGLNIKSETPEPFNVLMVSSIYV